MAKDKFKDLVLDEEELNASESLLMQREQATPKESEGGLAQRVAKNKKELKTKRVQLVIKPSMFFSIKALASKNNTSVNDVICYAVEQLLEKEG